MPRSDREQLATPVTKHLKDLLAERLNRRLRSQLKSILLTNQPFRKRRVRSMLTKMSCGNEFTKPKGVKISLKLKNPLAMSLTMSKFSKTSLSCTVADTKWSRTLSWNKLRKP